MSGLVDVLHRAAQHAVATGAGGGLAVAAGAFAAGDDDKNGDDDDGDDHDEFVCSPADFGDQ